jgi:AAA15 family ATPase/GTPase
MDSHFLTDIDIIDFKCFQNFSAKGFKRVNLIGGKNNIGKTAFMEACYVNTVSSNINNVINAIIFIQFAREKANLIFKNIEQIENSSFAKNFIEFIKKFSLKSNINQQFFEVKDQDGTKEYQFDIAENSKNINKNELNIEFSLLPYFKGNIWFIDSFGWMNEELVRAYQFIQKLDKEDELSSFVKEFDKNIVNFKIIGEKPLCKINEQYRNLTEFGDGLKHYISIICGLYACKNGYLFIDEIDNGIYYDQLDRLWEIILTISKETNCQVFATTHSKEMIESFARVSQKLNEQDISFITLVKNDKNEIKALVRNYELFLDSIEQEHEIRW